MERFDSPLNNPLPEQDGYYPEPGPGTDPHGSHHYPSSGLGAYGLDHGTVGYPEQGLVSSAPPGAATAPGTSYPPGPYGAEAGHAPGPHYGSVADPYGAGGEAQAPLPDQRRPEPDHGDGEQWLPSDDETVALRLDEVAADPDPEEQPVGGRAERRRAARGGRRRGTGSRRAAEGAEEAGTASAPLSRVEARRLARARKDSPAVVASRVVGELFITIGVLMLLFVAYQLWWTNVLAHQQAGGAANSLREEWKKGGVEDHDAGAFSPGEGFAIMYIPKLDVRVPIAEGIDKQKVLDRGMVGHYAEGELKTAMPWDDAGNFAVAGHRNTHGEPFRYVNRLRPGDEIIVETQSTFYIYEMASFLDQTPPSNVDVIGPVPAGSGFTDEGRYITLTTCTPEFTSKYRLIVWGKMVKEQPRSEGKPEALRG
ncbi:class E sortase [Streptomyces sp. TP-A0874]|uniref:class E sortase n=1 Tax=Streptomyces sp. TP-A0874 TaxID=549819 RepID=UPI00099F773B